MIGIRFAVLKKVDNALSEQRMKAALKLINNDKPTAPKGVEKRLAPPDQVLCAI
jgi:hypothetical protein